MRLQIKHIVLLVSVVLVFFVLGILVERKVVNNKHDKLTTALEFIKTHYAADYNEDDLVRNLANGLDENSYYLDPQTYQKLKNQDLGAYVGFGFFYSLKDINLKILEVFPDTPASRAELKSEDTITKIDGKLITSFSSPEEIAISMSGEENTKLVFEVTDNHGQIRVVELTRQKLNIPSLNYKTLQPEVGYLKIYSFRDTTTNEFNNIASKLQQDNIKKIIIDLRNNLGGNTEASLFIDRQFIDDGILINERFKNESSVSKAEGNAPFKNIEVVILVNKETSSAAEQMAAAFQDNKRAKIVGETTYGKDTIGNYVEFKDGSALHLTIGHATRPNGESIKGGIKPDVEIEDKREGDQDLILEAAI